MDTSEPTRSGNPTPTVGPLVTAGVALTDAAVVVIALHGRDQGPSHLLDQVVTRLSGQLAASWLLPTALGKSWYPDRADTDSTANDKAIADATTQLKLLCSRVAETTAAPLVMLGFSQGACLACEFAARHPGDLDAVVALTGGLTGADAEAFQVAPLPQPIPAYFAAGDADPWISVERIHATAAAFTAAGADTATDIAEGDGEHRIRSAEVSKVSDLLNRLTQPPS